MKRGIEGIGEHGMSMIRAVYNCKRGRASEGEAMSDGTCPLSAVEQQARLRGVQVETLINLWLQQKLAEQSPKWSRMRGSAPNTRPEGDCQG